MIEDRRIRRIEDFELLFTDLLEQKLFVGLRIGARSACGRSAWSNMRSLRVATLLRVLLTACAWKRLLRSLHGDSS